jgi:transposase
MKKNKKHTQVIPKLGSLDQLNLNAAGIDIGSSELWVCVPENRDVQTVRMFGTFTCDLHQIGTWLKDCHVDTVAMESTGIYWIPLYDLLEQEGFKVLLVNARQVKNVPGRKSDILDCQWIQQLHTYGLLRASFRPDKEIRKLRDLNRHQDNLFKDRSRHIQHMQKSLHLMNLQLDNVLSDITGKTGMTILRAIVDGKRDPDVLASYRDPKCKNSQEVIAKSLQGHYSDEHLFALKQYLLLYDHYTDLIHECGQEMLKCYKAISIAQAPLNPLGRSRKSNSHCKNAPAYDLRGCLYHLCGVDLTEVDGFNAVSLQDIILETGTDMTKWPSDKHFTSWLGCSPYNDISGGKIIKSKTKKTKNRATLAFRLCAQSLLHSKSALGAYARRMHARLGGPKSITAIANKLARIFYMLMKTKKPFVDLGEDYYIKKNRDREIKKMVDRAGALGFYLTPIQ